MKTFPFVHLPNLNYFRVHPITKHYIRTFAPFGVLNTQKNYLKVCIPEGRHYRTFIIESDYQIDKMLFPFSVGDVTINLIVGVVKKADHQKYARLTRLNVPYQDLGTQADPGSPECEYAKVVLNAPVVQMLMRKYKMALDVVKQSHVVIQNIEQPEKAQVPSNYSQSASKSILTSADRTKYQKHLDRLFSP